MIEKLKKAGVINPPQWLETKYLTVMGSVSYGISTESSDEDYYGFCIPPEEHIFPYKNKIYGFGTPPQTFDQFLTHGVEHEGKIYDLQIFNVVKYLNLAMAGNPNMLDSIFTDEKYVKINSWEARLVRENKHLFLSKQAVKKVIGYAKSNRHKLINKNPDPKSKRYEIIKEFSFDTKYASHYFRVANSAQQILMGKLDITAARNECREIRCGKWPLQRILEESDAVVTQVENNLSRSSIPDCADEEKIEKILRTILQGG